MADLTMLYQKYGLSELVKHALRKDGEAYRLVVEAVRGNAPLYLHLPRCTTYPLINTKEAPFVCLYASKLAAEERNSDISRHLPCDVVSAGTDDGVNKQALFETLRDVGVKYVQLDEQLDIPLDELVAPIDYDGYAEGCPFRNAAVNAALLLLRQNVEMGLDTTNLSVNLFRLLSNSGLVAPVMSTRGDEPGPIRDGDLRVPVYAPDGEPVSYWFSDQTFYENFAAANPELIKSLGVKILYCATIDNLRGFLNLMPEIELVINPGTLNLKFTRDTFLNIEGLLSGRLAAETVSVDDDPVPDFLRRER